MDNHSSHISFRASEICQERGITVVTIPPHSSHRTQPLDVSFFGPLKNAFNRQCDLFMNTQSGRRISQYDIAELFNNAYTTVATMEKAHAGFRNTQWVFTHSIP